MSRRHVSGIDALGQKDGFDGPEPMNLSRRVVKDVYRCDVMHWLYSNRDGNAPSQV